MILLIDNYDSFSYNLVQLIGSQCMDAEIKVFRNDALSTGDIQRMKPSHIILSPGPGRPKDAGICETVIQKLSASQPILGVCLGHQAICEAFGGQITYAAALMHGKQSKIKIDNSCPIFRGLPEEISAARYHSLAADKNTLPGALQVTARDSAGEIMAVKHKQLDVYGLQFHPESVLTPDGAHIIRNFLTLQRKEHIRFE